MADSLADVKTIFGKALEIRSLAERQAYLEQACGGDPRLRAEVESLLQVQQDAGGFLAGPNPSPVATIDAPVTEGPGTVIGPYKLLEEIGEGGMGTVWMAQQTEPVKRLVALKLIKAGMDSKQVIARFEAERQALALMDHPNIAKVLDGGAVGQAFQPDCRPGPAVKPDLQLGRPYFVMDLVKWVPITKYCDEHHLTPRQRLELFIPVCQAVQHAHQKGIIHRDIKPSNVLVALYDGKPVPKVIDFGVAKAAGQSLTDKTLVTGFGAIVGTLEYMSPEQAEINQLDIDTRSDIYSLGVLLYELLAGSPPFSRKELEKAGVLEMLRVIREQEPSKPSTKLSTAEGLPTLAANRGTEPAKLTKLVRGELDWIVMKALEKDRNRRYETASGFAMDVQRYLADDPVLACPPSMGYRLKKFVRRNKVKVAFAAVVLLFLVLLGGGVGYTISERASRQTRVAAQVEQILGEADRLMKETKWPEALTAAKRAEAALAGGDADRATEDRVRQQLADLMLVQRLEAARLLESEDAGAGIGWNYAGAEAAYAGAFTDAGFTIEGVTVRAAADQLQARSRIVTDLAAALTEWARLRKQIRKGSDDSSWHHLLAVADEIDPDPWRRRLRGAWKAKDADAEKRLRDLADSADVRTLPPSTVVLLGRLLRDRVSFAEGAKLLHKAQEHRPDDFWINFDLAGCLQRSDKGIAFYHAARAVRPESAMVLNNLGVCHWELGRLEEAIPYYKRAVELAPEFAFAHNNLGVSLKQMGRLEEAIACYKKAIELDPKYAMCHSNFGLALQARGQIEEAVAFCKKAIELDPIDTKVHNGLGEVLRLQNKLDAAIGCYRRAIELDPKNAPAHNNLGLAIGEQGNLEEAVASVHKAIELDAKQTIFHNDLGTILAQQGKLEQAIACFRKAIELDPKNVMAHTNWALALLEQKKFAEAIAFCRTAFEIDPRFARAHYVLGDILSCQGKLNEAVAAYRVALRLDPKYIAAHNDLGLALRKQGESDDAIASFRRAIEIDPKYPQAHLNLGLALHDQGKLDEAIACCRKVTELAPKAAQPHYGIAVSLQTQGKLKEAVASYREAIKRDSKYLDALNNLGNALREQRELDEAIACYRKAVEIDPKFAMAHNNLGVALGEQGKLDDAIACCKRAIEIDANHVPAYRNLGLTLMQQGKREEAIAIYRKGIAVNPEDALMLNNLAWLFATSPETRLRNPQEAVALARRAVKHDAKGWHNWNTLSIAAYRVEKWQEALDAREEAIQRYDKGEPRCWNGLGMAMIRWHLGQKEEARKAYDRVAEEAKSNDLKDFRKEADELLGIPPAKSKQN